MPFSHLAPYHRIAREVKQFEQVHIIIMWGNRAPVQTSEAKNNQNYFHRSQLRKYKGQYNLPKNLPQKQLVPTLRFHIPADEKSEPLQWGREAGGDAWQSRCFQPGLGVSFAQIIYILCDEKVA